MGRIQAADQVNKASRILQLIMAAARPLTLREMSIAYATDERHVSWKHVVSFGELDLDLEENYGHRVRNICGLFVSVVDNKIYLIHQTARDFLASHSATDHIKADHSLSKRSWEHSLSLTESNLRPLRICVAIILFQNFEDDSTGPYAAIGQADSKTAEFLFAEMMDGTTRREVRALILTKPDAGFLEYAADLW